MDDLNHGGRATTCGAKIGPDNALELHGYALCLLFPEMPAWDNASKEDC